MIFLNSYKNLTLPLLVQLSKIQHLPFNLIVPNTAGLTNSLAILRLNHWAAYIQVVIY